MSGVVASPPKLSQYRLKLRVQRTCQLHELSAAGVAEPQPRGVEALPVKPRDRLFRAVDGISVNGEIGRAHV